jgi:hypothetical protein
VYGVVVMMMMMMVLMTRAGWCCAVLRCVRDEISLQMGALSLASYIHTLPVLYLRCCPYSISPSLVHVS